MNIVHQLQLILLSKYAADSSLFERCQEHTRGAHRFILLMLAAEQGPQILGFIYTACPGTGSAADGVARRCGPE